LTTNAFWNAEEGSGGAGLRSGAASPTAWRQTTLIPSDPLEVRLRLGYLLHDRHVRWQVEAYDPTTRELLAMHAKPHEELDRLRLVPASALLELGSVVEALLNPDPF
jgi:hypothetical protein